MKYQKTFSGHWGFEMAVEPIQQALVLGFERISAWAELLDAINVFPVADGDTGRNLRVSLLPLRTVANGRKKTLHRLLMSARGNSGNIAARFFSRFIEPDAISKIPEAARLGRDAAWQAVHDPVPGTMLTVFDELVSALDERQGAYLDKGGARDLVRHLEKAVRSTPERLPILRKAGVVDSGALGMFIFFEGFFMSLTGETLSFQPVTRLFKDSLCVSNRLVPEPETGYCVDTVIQLSQKNKEAMNRFSKRWESVSTIPHEAFLKVHLHAPDREEARREISELGRIVSWSDDNLEEQVARFRNTKPSRSLHIMTDAAGSVTLEDSKGLGMTLLDSYVTAGEMSLPETLFSSEALYEKMRDGVNVSTSQASDFERYEAYQRVLGQYERVLYLCVGSVYTGNYDAVMAWKRNHDPEDRLTVIDTGTASGQLGTIALLSARLAASTKHAGEVMAFALKAVSQCREYVFLDRLQYLAAGGRLSRTSAFLGDMLHMKPIVSPTAEGAQKVGMAKGSKDQIRFALKKLGESLNRDSRAFIMLEYSDNETWVETTVLPEITLRYPVAEVMCQPLSLTSGAHMGPGTWAMAFLPETVLFKDGR